MTASLKPISLTILFFSIMFNLFGQGTKSKVDKEFKKIQSKIYPVIKLEVTTPDEEVDLLIEGQDAPVFRKLAGDLLCFYGIDRGNHFEIVQKKHLPEHTDISALDDLARENLLRTLDGQIQMQKTDFNVIGFTCGGEHEAALITVPEIWDIVVEKLGQNVVFAVPSKDLVMYVKADDQAGIEGLQKIVTSVHEGGERLLSTHLFTYSDGKIEKK